MLSEKQFTSIKKKAAAFPYQSFLHIGYEHCRNCNVIKNGESVLLIDTTASPKLVFFAVRSPEEFVADLKMLGGDLQVNFVPAVFVQTLKDIGFELLAEFGDYFNRDLKKTAAPSPAGNLIDYLKDDEMNRVSLLSRRCYGQSRGFRGESPEWFREWRRTGDTIVVRKAGEIVGFCCVSIYDNGRILWIREIAVDPAFQGQGYGKRLMEQSILYGIEKGASTGFLAADLQNENAIGLYNKYNFFNAGDDSEIQMVRLEK